MPRISAEQLYDNSSVIEQINRIDKLADQASVDSAAAVQAAENAETSAGNAADSAAAAAGDAALVNDKAPKANPTFTGKVKVPNADYSDGDVAVNVRSVRADPDLMKNTGDNSFVGAMIGRNAVPYRKLIAMDRTDATRSYDEGLINIQDSNGRPIFTIQSKQVANDYRQVEMIMTFPYGNGQFKGTSLKIVGKLSDGTSKIYHDGREL